MENICLIFAREKVTFVKIALQFDLPLSLREKLNSIPAEIIFYSLFLFPVPVAKRTCGNPS